MARRSLLLLALLATVAAAQVQVGSTVPGARRPAAFLVDVDVEENDFSDFDGDNGDVADLSVTAGAALDGSSFGVFYDVPASPDADPHYHFANFASAWTGDELWMRVHFDPTGLGTPGANDASDIVSADDSGDTWRLRITCRERPSGATQCRAAVQLDSGTSTLAYQNLTTAAHCLEVRLLRASSSVASDGELELWADGSFLAENTGLDVFDVSRPNRVRLGNSDLATFDDAGGDFALDELLVRGDGTQTGC